MQPEVEYRAAKYDAGQGQRDRVEAMGEWLNEWAVKGWKVVTIERLQGHGEIADARFLVIFERRVASP